MAMLAMQATAIAQESHAQAELLANVSTIKPGEPFMLGVRFKIEPEWHIYWTNPGDSGLPTEVKLKLPAGFTAGPVQYPVPERLQLPGDIINYAYESVVMLLVEVTPPKVLADKTITIGGKATWLVCKDECMPGQAALSLEIPVSGEAAAGNEALFKTWKAKLPKDGYTYGDIGTWSSTYKKGSKADGDIAQMNITWGVKTSDVQFIPDAADGVDVSDIKVVTVGTESKISFVVKGASDGQKLSGLVTYLNSAGERVGMRSVVTASELKAAFFGRGQ